MLLVVSGFFTDIDLLDHARNIGTKVILLCTEYPYEDDRQLETRRPRRLCVLNDPTNLDWFQAVTESVYLPHAYRPIPPSPRPITRRIRV